MARHNENTAYGYCVPRFQFNHDYDKLSALKIITISIVCNSPLLPLVHTLEKLCGWCLSLLQPAFTHSLHV